MKSTYFKDQEKSLTNFMWDIFISSSIFKDYLYQISDIIITDKDKQSLLEYFQKDLPIWEKIYNERICSLRQRTHIISQGEKTEVKEVSYHSRFGWILNNGNSKSFLGKINILENVKLNIGCRTYFSGHGTLRGNDTVNIGSYTAIAEGCYINSSNDSHPVNYPSLFGFKTERRLKEDNMNLQVQHKNISTNGVGISIGNDVWFCRNVRVLGGVTIGDGCVIAENAFVNKNCEPYGVYAGIPAKLIRYRFPKDVIEKLLQIKWWDWDYGKIRKNTVFFDTDLSNGKFDFKKLID